MGDWFDRHPIVGFGVLWIVFRASEIFLTALLTGR